MRAITSEAVSAFYNNETFSKSNTEVVVDGDLTVMTLFGNAIAQNTPEGLFISLAGWATPTTKERLNNLRGVSIHQKKFVQYLTTPSGQQVMDKKEWYHIQ